MHETVLGQIVSQRDITAQFAQKIPHLRLVSTHQLAERPGVLCRHHPGDKLIVVYRMQRWLLDYSLRPAKKCRIM